MSRVGGRVLRPADVIDVPYPIEIRPNIPSEQFEMPFAVVNVKRKYVTGAPAPAPSNPMMNPPLFFNQFGNSASDLFEAPVENFNFKFAPVSYAEQVISRDRLSTPQLASRYSALTSPQ